MAAFLANTIHKIIKTNLNHENGFEVVLTAKKKPINAKGIANMVCVKVTKER